MVSGGGRVKAAVRGLPGGNAATPGPAAQGAARPAGSAAPTVRRDRSSARSPARALPRPPPAGRREAVAMLSKHRWTRVSATGGALAAVAALAAAPAAQGAAPWLSAQGLSPSGQQAADVQAAVNPEGSAIAVWDARAGASWVVTAAARPSGGTWGPPQPVSGPLAGGPGTPDVAIDGEGNAVVVWNVAASTPAATAVQAAVRPAATGAWRPAVTLADAATGAQVAMDGVGNAVAAWT